MVGGLYRRVRNPMYLAVVATILGQAPLLAQPGAAGLGRRRGRRHVAFATGYEEPTLAARYGAEYERYRSEVPGWWPRRIEKT